MTHLTSLRQALRDIEAAIATLAADQLEPHGVPESQEPTVKEPNAEMRRLAARGTGHSPLSQQIIDSLAQLEALKGARPHPTLVAALSGYLPKVPAYRRALSSLAESGMVVSKPDSLRLTTKGRDAIVNKAIIFSNKHLAELVAKSLPRVSAELFICLAGKNGLSIPESELGVTCQISASGTEISEAIGQLLDLALIERRQGRHLACTEMLYPF